MNSLFYRILSVVVSCSLIFSAGSGVIVAASDNSPGNKESWVFGGNSAIEDFFDQIFGNNLRADLDGSQEVPGPGDIDGRGEVKVKIKEDKSEICWDIKTSYIDGATAAHIKHAPWGSAGAVVVPLSIPDEEGEAEGCVEVNSGLLKAIKENPQDYYVNIHTNPYPNGAVRGQFYR